MGPADTWDPLADWLRAVGRRFAHAKALLVISGHWEEPTLTVQSNAAPPLLFDYHGFPPHTYALTWPAPGAPRVAQRVVELLTGAGFPTTTDAARGFDHGVFVPLKVAFPDAQVPTVQLSLHGSLDAALHLKLGRALAPLRDEGVLIVGSGLSFHNMQAMMRPGAGLDRSRRFDDWLTETCSGAPAARDASLAAWEGAPEARYSHPREEHLIPLMVAAGAGAGEAGRHVFGDQVMGVRVSAFEFGNEDGAPRLTD